MTRYDKMLYYYFAIHDAVDMPPLILILLMMMPLRLRRYFITLR